MVDVFSLQRFGDHNRVAQELERASTCMAAKLMQAGCEIATKEPKVPSNSIFVRAKLQARLQRERKLGIDFASVKASDHSGAASAAGEVQRTCQADQENPLQIVGAMAATAGADCACLSVKSKPLRGGGHWAQ